MPVPMNKVVAVKEPLPIRHVRRDSTVLFNLRKRLSHFAVGMDCSLE